MIEICLWIGILKDTVLPCVYVNKNKDQAFHDISIYKKIAEILKEETV